MIASSINWSKFTDVKEEALCPKQRYSRSDQGSMLSGAFSTWTNSMTTIKSQREENVCVPNSPQLICEKPYSVFREPLKPKAVLGFQESQPRQSRVKKASLRKTTDLGHWHRRKCQTRCPSFCLRNQPAKWLQKSHLSLNLNFLIYKIVMNNLAFYLPLICIEPRS